MKHLDLFSGIGGFALAARWAGFETVAFCEKNDYCRDVLRKHWDDVPMYEDIRRVTGDRLKRNGIEADIITGGFPCQPFSVAGKRGGKGDDRYLWPEMLRIIQEMEPAWVIGENVRGIVNMELDQVLADLEDNGYSTESFVIPACAVNAPHRRDRVWIIANSSRQRLQGGEETGNDGSNGQKPWDEQLTGRSGVERWNKFPTVSPVCGRNDGISNRIHRLKALGNAVVPQIPFYFFEIIKKIESNKKLRPFTLEMQVND